MSLQRRLQISSDLAQVQQVITLLRGSQPLTEGLKTHLKKYMWPWWKWVMHQRGRNEVEPRAEGDNPLFDVVKDKTYIEHNRARLEAICDYLWGEEPMSEEVQVYCLALMLNFRSRLLVLSSNIHSDY